MERNRDSQVCMDPSERRKEGGRVGPCHLGADWEAPKGRIWVRTSYLAIVEGKLGPTPDWNPP